MKKNLWILLAISALIAMFVISGCQKAVTPTPTPTPTATAQPTPTPDVKCPEVVSTQIVKGYSMIGWDSAYGEIGVFPEAFQIVITFNEEIDPIGSSCIYDLSKWDVIVKNKGRITTEINWADVVAVKVDGKRIILLCLVEETGLVKPVEFKYKTVAGDIYSGSTPVIEEDYFYYPGLICSKDDAQLYADIVNGLKWYDYDILSPVVIKLANYILPDIFLGTTTPLYTPPTVADVVSWKLASTCVVADELGNYCCGFSGEACCLEPVCATCADECPFDTAGGTCITCTPVCQ